MKSYTVKFSARATNQLTELYSYIADHSDEVRASHFVDGVISCCRALETFPERGTKRDDIHPRLRTLGYARRVTIAFAVDPTDAIVILGIFADSCAGLSTSEIGRGGSRIAPSCDFNGSEAGASGMTGNVRGKPSSHRQIRSGGVPSMGFGGTLRKRGKR